MIFLLLFILPMAVALAAEYLVCRIPKSRVWRILPPAALILGGLAALWGRCRGWGDGPACRCWAWPWAFFWAGGCGVGCGGPG